MSGNLRVLPPATPYLKHDHLELVFGLRALRLNDPRRFGSVHWQPGDVDDHWLLRDLGPEPFAAEFGGAWLKATGKGATCGGQELHHG